MSVSIRGNPQLRLIKALVILVIEGVEKSHGIGEELTNLAFEKIFRSRGGFDEVLGTQYTEGKFAGKVCWNHRRLWLL